MRRGFVESSVLLSVAAAVVIGVPLLMYLVQDKLVFMPQPMGEVRRSQVKQSLPGVEELFVEIGRAHV